MTIDFLMPKYVVSVDMFGDEVLSMESGATFSSCQRYRYTLWHRWSKGETVQFIGLNPSTADATLDDPTIRRCIGFAKTWGFGSLIMTNLFAWRATQPKDMLSTIDPVGPDNDDALNVVYAHTALTVAAWGVYGAHLGRDKVVRKMFPRLYYLQLTEDGHPKHPLYLPATLRPLEWDF